ncbi:MAG: Calx-beta domain-containing protein [Chloroflexota bacterium]
MLLLIGLQVSIQPSEATQLDLLKPSFVTLTDGLVDGVSTVTISNNLDIIDISVGQVVYPDEPVLPTQPVVYSLFITNSSAITVSNIIVTDVVPSQIESTSILSTSNGSQITSLGGYPTYSWQIDNLGPQKRAALYIVGVVSPRQNEDMVITNTLMSLHPLDTISQNNTSLLPLNLIVPEVAFEKSEIRLSEDRPTLTVNIQLEPVNPYGSTSVDYSTQSLLQGFASGNPIDYQAISGTISFDAAIQNTNSISITLFEDSVSEGTESFQIVLSNPVGAKLSSRSTMTVVVEDNDVSGINVGPQYLNLSEDGRSAEYTISLDSRPIEPVMVEVLSLPQIAVEPNVLTFTLESWNTPQVVKAFAFDDSVAEGVHPGIINHRVHSADKMYNDIVVKSIGAGIVDDDRAGIVVSAAHLKVVAGVPENLAKSAYSVTLQSQPTNNVTVQITPSEPSLQFSPDKLYFTPADWSVAQRVVAYTMDERQLPDPNVFEVNHTITESTDKVYATLGPAPISAQILPPEIPDILHVSTEELTTPEGKQNERYMIALNARPNDTVTLTIDIDERLAIAPSELVFDSTNWEQPQPVTVTVMEESKTIGSSEGVIALAAQSNDQRYAALAPLTITMLIKGSGMAIYLPYFEAP